MLPTTACRSKVENAKLARELEEVKQRTNALLIKAADEHTMVKRR
jgi:hypothetical protein